MGHCSEAHQTYCSRIGVNTQYIGLIACDTMLPNAFYFWFCFSPRSNSVSLTTSSSTLLEILLLLFIVVVVAAAFFDLCAYLDSYRFLA